MSHNLQRVEEELQSSSALVAPPLPPRATAVTAAKAGDDATEDDYLVVLEDDTYEVSDTVEPLRQRHVLPGQMSMPESALPPSLMPRKQSCPDTSVTTRRAARPLPQAPTETGRPTDTTRLKPTHGPPVAARKK